MQKSAYLALAAAPRTMRLPMLHPAPPSLALPEEARPPATGPATIPQYAAPVPPFAAPSTVTASPLPAQPAPLGAPLAAEPTPTAPTRLAASPLATEMEPRAAPAIPVAPVPTTPPPSLHASRTTASPQTGTPTPDGPTRRPLNATPSVAETPARPQAERQEQSAPSVPARAETAAPLVQSPLAHSDRPVPLQTPSPVQPSKSAQPPIIHPISTSPRSTQGDRRAATSPSIQQPATPEIQIGTIEIRTAAPQPPALAAPQPRPAPRTPASPNKTRLAHGYGWSSPWGR